MKTSEILRNQARSEENDLAALGIYKKVLRAERSERFDNYKGKIIDAGYKLTEHPNHKFTIDGSQFGLIDYFPKANKVLIRKTNKWVTGGLRWIRKNLLDV